MKNQNPTPSSRSINSAATPAKLRTMRRWVVWYKELRDNGKMAKVPYDAKTGKKASITNPQTWATYEEALEYYERFKDQGCCGIGFVFTAGDHIVGIDLDKCINLETGEIEAWALQIIQQLNSYTELSPSGIGLHVFVQGHLPPGSRRKGQVEMYDCGRYFTVTGQALAGYPSTVENRQRELEEIFARTLGGDRDTSPQLHRGGHLAASPKAEASEWQALLAQMEEAELTPADEDILNRLETGLEGKIYQLLVLGQWEEAGAYRKKGLYKSISEADQALMNKLARLTGGNVGGMKAIFLETGLMRDKIEKHPTYLAVTIKKAIDGLAWRPVQEQGNIQGVGLDA